MKNNIIVPIVVAVVVGIGGFYSGMTYARQGGAPVGGVQGSGRNFAMGMGMRGAGRGMMGGAPGGFNSGFVTGDVVSTDATSMTVKLRDGGSKIVLFSATTAVSKSVAGSAADIMVGGRVMVTGVANPDGSVTAETIQIRPDGAPGQ